ncbi:antibiotic biosynthesis monooxygenase [Rubrobacter tropicus]|uniref:Antibiotic biosynthesis monooxygenase n=1 Tax=Rubrobacter tropicus TaxID=2653851 RepID=A0A6G8Q7H0_9ACTN|nr:antibiotic biosynthesis monooxygenase [Rubrobacter tropicus]QIN82393.1 antibiotic biosynthesis monooxygenase [Rubrobacter tropicus]
MIARIWHGVTAAVKPDEYLDYRAAEGNRGVYVLRRIEADRAHSLTVSFWEPGANTVKLAGPDPEKARYCPGDEKFLLDFEAGVEHYEVVAEP